MKLSQEKSKTMPNMQIVLGVKEVYYGIVQEENWAKEFHQLCMFRSNRAGVNVIHKFIDLTI